jgi:outer membrane receptor protein involved in Fe transport
MPRSQISAGVRNSLFAGFLLLMSAFANAQELGTAVLSGDVSDPQGAVVKGAQVVAKRSSTGATRSTSTNGAGLFVFNALQPGSYEVQVSAPGFADATAAVSLRVGQQLNVPVRLAVGKEKTVVTIEDTASLTQVDTASSVVDGVVSAHQIDNLPLNGRNFAELSLLIPGNVPAPNFDPTKANTFLVSSAGQLGRGTNTSIDGSDDNDDAVGGMLLNAPEDAVQEFQIATNRFSAEVGRSGSSVINVVTKSGSNSLHGLASVYERDKVLQAAPINFNPAAGGTDTPPFRRQQYSGTLGGPLVKDKAWWFGAFEYRDEIGGSMVGTRDLATRTISTSFAPAPLTDTLGNARADWQASNNDRLAFRYLIERQSSSGLSGAQTPLVTALERQVLKNNFQDFLTSWTHILTPTLLNKFSFSVNNFFNSTFPVQRGVEIDFPSITDGASFRVPQQTWQNRLQFDESLAWTHGRHNLRFGGEGQRLDDKFDLAVFQDGRIIAVQDFSDFDHNNDGVINDKDLLFAVTLRSGFPTQSLVLPNCDNNHIAFYAQDDWHVHPQFTLNAGVRYELDTDVNNVSGYANRNPIVNAFYHGNRHKDTNNWGPRVGFNWATKQGQLSVHGGYGIYYDRITLEIESLERGLDGRALPVEVRAGNVTTDQQGNPIFLDSQGHFVPGAPTLSNPFAGFIFPGAGAGGINIIDNNIQNPQVQQFDLGVQWEPVHNWVVKVDGIHNYGTHFIIGVPVGSVFNPVVGGPDVVKNLESSVNTHYDALWLTVDKRFASHFQMHAAYTLSKSLDYANDDQIPFSYPPLFPNDLHREYGPATNDQRHRLVLQAVADLPFKLRFAPLWTIASGVPMDIKLPDNSTRVPGFMRNAGGREFHNAAELNAALTQLGLPNVPANAKFSDSYNTFDMRLSRDFHIREGMSVQALAEVFNLFNITNYLGTSTANYSGFNNVISPNFGKPVSQAGGVFGSGGPRAFQLGAKLVF